MSNDLFSQLNTKELADTFSNFLAIQGLGEKDPVFGARYRQGVELSPMDDILTINGHDLDDLFRRRLPEPPPQEPIQNISSGQSVVGKENISVANAISAVQSLGLSKEAMDSLNSMLQGSGNADYQKLPGSIRQLLQNNNGASSASDLLLQMGKLYSLIGETPLPDGKDIAQVLIDLMNALGTNSPQFLLNTLSLDPLLLIEALRDPITGISRALGRTAALLRPINAFKSDPIIGSSQSETLLASRTGGSRLIGGGGLDLFVIPLSSKPFAQSVIIQDFDALTGSKVVLDVTDYKGKIGKRFKVAKNSKHASRIAKSKVALIFNSDTGELLLNGNMRKSGLGSTGGVILKLENESFLTPSDLLIYKNSSLWQLNGREFIA